MAKVKLTLAEIRQKMEEFKRMELDELNSQLPDLKKSMEDMWEDIQSKLAEIQELEPAFPAPWKGESKPRAIRVDHAIRDLLKENNNKMNKQQVIDAMLAHKEKYSLAKITKSLDKATDATARIAFSVVGDIVSLKP